MGKGDKDWIVQENEDEEEEVENKYFKAKEEKPQLFVPIFSIRVKFCFFLLIFVPLNMC